MLYAWKQSALYSAACCWKSAVNNFPFVTIPFSVSFEIFVVVAGLGAEHEEMISIKKMSFLFIRVVLVKL